MKYRALVVLPIVVSAVFLTLALLLPERALVLRVENELLKVMALGGCAAAALAFERGEYMRRAWGLNAVCYAFLLSRDGLFLAGIANPTLQGALVFAGNLASVVGIWLMARAADEAGIELPGSPGRRGAIYLGATLISVAITAQALLADGRDMIHSNPYAIVTVASDLGDIVSMALIAPVLLTAFALRGGVLRWTWALFAASLFFWLTYDAARSFFESTIQSFKVGVEVFRALACTFTLAAGLAHRLAVSPDAAKDSD